MAKPKWIVFDVGGVLYDFKSVFADISRLTNLDMSVINPVITSHIGKDELGGITLEEVWLDVLTPHGLADKLTAVMEIWWDPKYWVQDTFSLMPELKNRGYHIAIMTNNWENMGNKIRQVPGMELAEQFFESCVLKMRKPDANIFHYASSAVGCKDNEMLLSDNSASNITGAKNAGWQSLIYDLGDDRGLTANTELRSQLL